MKLPNFMERNYKKDVWEKWNLKQLTTFIVSCIFCKSSAFFSITAQKQTKKLFTRLVRSERNATLLRPDCRFAPSGLPVCSVLANTPPKYAEKPLNKGEAASEHPTQDSTLDSTNTPPMTLPKFWGHFKIWVECWWSDEASLHPAHSLCISMFQDCWVE